MLPSLINAEYEYIALHRDVGETELKQVCLIFRQSTQVLMAFTGTGNSHQRKSCLRRQFCGQRCQTWQDPNLRGYRESGEGDNAGMFLDPFRLPLLNGCLGQILNNLLENRELWVLFLLIALYQIKILQGTLMMGLISFIHIDTPN